MALPTKRMCELAGRRKMDHEAWKTRIRNHLLDVYMEAYNSETKPHDVARF